MGQALVCPKLHTWISAHLAVQSAIFKERRKARQEGALAFFATTHGSVETLDGVDGGRERRREQGEEVAEAVGGVVATGWSPSPSPPFQSFAYV